MTESKFTYRAMKDVLDQVKAALDDLEYLETNGHPFNQNGIPALRVTDDHGWTFVVTALPEHD
jgi:hypothetical protein